MAKKINDGLQDVLYMCEAGNSKGFYRAVFSRVGVNDYALEIFEIESGEKQVEHIKQELVLAERVHIRPIMDDLDSDTITKRAKAIETFLKKNKLTPEDALEVDKKTKKTLIDSGLNFPCEKIIIEERILKDVPIYKLETVTEFEKIKTMQFYTKISNKDVRNTLTNFINI